jgi:hypothetical protein
MRCDRCRTESAYEVKNSINDIRTLQELLGPSIIAVLGNDGILYFNVLKYVSQNTKAIGVASQLSLSTN